MRSYMPWQASIRGEWKPCRRIASHQRVLFAVLSVVAWLALIQSGAAQNSAAVGQTQSVSHVRNATPSQPPSGASSVSTPAVQGPAENIRPDWPANAQPVKAKVEWNSQGLYIVAENSSLKQILEDASAATGAKLDGLGEDERVFGAYGPGTARDVLSKLLDGTGYNVLMSGDQGQGTPRQIVLSRRSAGSPQSAPTGAPGAPSIANQDAAEEDEPAQEEPQPVEETQQAQPQAPPQASQQPQQPQTPIRPVFGSGSPRTPQQIIQEMQERQQQQQQEQQNNSQ